MELEGCVLKLSRIEFEDKGYRENIRLAEGDRIEYYGEPDGECINCEIPELEIGERVVLNAWGSYESRTYVEHRRRFGIYSVVSKEDGRAFNGDDLLDYVFKLEKGLSEGEIVHRALSGDFDFIQEKTAGMKYIGLNEGGRGL